MSVLVHVLDLMGQFRFRPSYIFDLYGEVEDQTHAEVVAPTVPNPTAFRCGSVSSMEKLISILDTALHQGGEAVRKTEKVALLGGIQSCVRNIQNALAHGGGDPPASWVSI